MSKKERLLKTKALIESGYAGVDKEGQIVDRRMYYDAMPIQKNRIFAAPEPKEVCKRKAELLLFFSCEKGSKVYVAGMAGLETTVIGVEDGMVVCEAGTFEAGRLQLIP